MPTGVSAAVPAADGDHPTTSAARRGAAAAGCGDTTTRRATTCGSASGGVASARCPAARGPAPGGSFRNRNRE